MRRPLRPFDVSAEFVARGRFKAGGRMIAPGRFDKSQFDDATLRTLYARGLIRIRNRPAQQAGAIVADRLGVPVRRKVGVDGHGKAKFAIFLRGQKITSDSTDLAALRKEASAKLIKPDAKQALGSQVVPRKR
jgi:hypothetical protein